MKYELGDGEGVTSGAVHKCKVACNTENRNEAHKTACEVGCTLKGPYLLNCQNTFKSDSSNSCKKAVNSNKCNALKRQPINTYYSELSQAKDSNGVSLVDGCCDCGGGKFGPPSAIVNNNKYTSCYDFNNTTSGYYPEGGTPVHGCYSTIGIENHMGNQGLQYTFDNQYSPAAMSLSDGDAIFITTGKISYTLGDLNFDSTVNVLDVVTLVNIVLNIIEPNSAQELASDLNGDGTLNVLDVVLIVNLALGT